MGKLKSLIIFSATTSLTVLATYQLTWTIPQLSYRMHSSAIKSACAHIQAGMDRTSVLRLMREEAWVTVEAEVPSGLYFYGNSSCEVSFDGSTGRVSAAIFKEGNDLGIS